MSIPVATTRVQLLASSHVGENAEDWDGEFVPVGDPIRAHFSAPSGLAAAPSSGATSTTTFRLLTDPVDIAPGMRVCDVSTGVVYDVAWCQTRNGPAPYSVAGVTLVTASA